MEFLEGIEREHSTLLVMKGKADAELYKDIEAIKEDLKVHDGKIAYCMDMLADSDEGSVPEDEEQEEEYDHDIEGGREDAEDFPAGAAEVLPWVERMRLLGYISGEGNSSQPSSSQ